jgi:hypothetical protein
LILRWRALLANLIKAPQKARKGEEMINAHVGATRSIKSVAVKADNSSCPPMAVL